MTEARALTVLFVQRQPCIRTLKYVEGFRAAGFDFAFCFAYEQLTLSEFYGHGDEQFSNWWRLGDDPAATLRKIVAAESIDVIHCHNGPDTLTNLCIDNFTGTVPIVHDIHDLMTARLTQYDDARVGSTVAEAADIDVPLEVWQTEERRAVEQSDGVIAVSDEILELAAQRGYRLPEATEVYANYIPERFIPDPLPVAEAWDGSRPLRVVYEGSLNTDGGHYDLRDIFRQLADHGFEVHVYGSRPEPAYDDLAAHVAGIVYHETLPPERLYRELPRYDLGWAGFNDALNRDHLETVLPNKLYEYIACGLPVVSFRHQALANFIEQHRVGMVIDETDELPDALTCPRLESLRESVATQRYDHTVELNIRRIADLYRRLASESCLAG